MKTLLNHILFASKALLAFSISGLIFTPRQCQRNETNDERKKRKHWITFFLSWKAGLNRFARFTVKTISLANFSCRLNGARCEARSKQHFNVIYSVLLSRLISSHNLLFAIKLNAVPCFVVVVYMEGKEFLEWMYIMQDKQHSRSNSGLSFFTFDFRKWHISIVPSGKHEIITRFNTKLKIDILCFLFFFRCWLVVFVGENLLTIN